MPKIARFSVQLENGRTFRASLYSVSYVDTVLKYLRHLAPGAVIEHTVEDVNLFNTPAGVIDDFGRWRKENEHAQGPLGDD